MPELPEEPKAGEPLRVTWARRLLTLLRSMRLRAGPGIVLSADAEGTSVALAPELRVHAKPRPFAVRLALDNAANAPAGAVAVYCCLPPETAEAVRYGAQALAPGASVQLGTAENPWVRLLAASDQTPPLWLCVIAPGEQSGSASGSGSSGSGSSGSSGSGSSGGAGTWELQFSQTAPTQSASGDYACKAHLVAECTLSGGVIQYHLGSLLLDGSGDEWKADSDAEQFFSIDPPSVAIKYETETVDETVTQIYGKGIDGQPLTRQVTVKKTRVKTDANGNPIPKQRQARDANGNPAVDGNGDPVMEPDTTPAIYHQVHNFDSGSDNELLELAGEDGYGGTAVACRVIGARGFAELLWRRIPRTPPQCIPSYALEEQSGSGCAEKSIVLKKTSYTKDSQGRCQAGTPQPVGNPIEIPKPPTYSLAEAADSTQCLRKWKLQKTICGGQPQDVDQTVIEIPGKDSISATSTGSTAAGAQAGTITVTPCGGSPKTITVFNGPRGPGGNDGCSPVVTAAAEPEVHGTLACTIQGRTLGQNGCENAGAAVNVYNGRNGADATICGSFQAVAGVRVQDGYLQFNLVTYTFAKNAETGCWEPVAGADNWQNSNLQVRGCS